jgi:hypothetical protein
MICWNSFYEQWQFLIWKNHTSIISLNLKTLVKFCFQSAKISLSLRIVLLNKMTPAKLRLVLLMPWLQTVTFLLNTRFLLLYFFPYSEKIWWVSFLPTSLGFYVIGTDPQTDSCDDVTITISNVNLKLPYICTTRGKGLSNIFYECTFREYKWEKIWWFYENCALPCFTHRNIKRKLFNTTLIYLILKCFRSPSGYKLFIQNEIFYTYPLLIYPLNSPDRLWSSLRFSFNSYPCINWPDRKADRLSLLTSR